MPATFEKQKWRCCKCSFGLLNRLFESSCPSCGHHQCDQCSRSTGHIRVNALSAATSLITLSSIYRFFRETTIDRCKNNVPIVNSLRMLAETAINEATNLEAYYHHVAGHGNNESGEVPTIVQSIRELKYVATKLSQPVLPLDMRFSTELLAHLESPNGSDENIPRYGDPIYPPVLR